MVRLPTEQGEWIEARARRLGLRPGEVLRMILMDRWHDEQTTERKQTERPNSFQVAKRNSLRKRCAIARSQNERAPASCVSYANDQRDGPICKIWTHSRFCSLTLTETISSLDERRV
jgi:hypothetical protein